LRTWRHGLGYKANTQRVLLSDAERHLELARETLVREDIQNISGATTALATLHCLCPYPGRGERMARAIGMLEAIAPKLKTGGYVASERSRQLALARLLMELPYGDRARNLEQAYEITAELASQPRVGVTAWRYNQFMWARASIERLLAIVTQICNRLSTSCADGRVPLLARSATSIVWTTSANWRACCGPLRLQDVRIGWRSRRSCWRKLSI
jgi:hypothetical protein